MPDRTDMPAAEAASGTAASGCRVHAVVRAREWRDAPLEALAGIAGLRLLPMGAVAAVIESAAPDDAAGPVALLLRHETVVTTLAGRAVAAPVAAECVAADEAEVRTWLHHAEPTLADLLDRVDGRCEVGVLAWWDRDRAAAAAASAVAAGEPAGPVRDAFRGAVAAARAQQALLQAQLARDPHRPTYLLRRVLRVRQAAVAAAYADGVAAALHAALAGAAEAGHRAAPAGAELLLDGAYLVRRERVPELDRVVGGLAETYRGAVTLRRTAPGVPWRFATLRPFATRDGRPRGALAVAGGAA